MSERSLANDRAGSGDRIAGAVIVAFSLLLWFVLIPDQVDGVDYGWMRPQTLPGICTVALGFLGALLLVRPGRTVADADIGQVLRLSALISLVLTALLAMSHFGFLYVAPPLAALFVLLLGERRWTILLAAAAGAPAVIWLVVDVVLHRPLP